MRTPIARLTTRGTMAAVAVLALDCSCLRATYGGQGVLLVGLALNFALFRWWCGLAAKRPFWLGFTVSGSAAMLAYLACCNCTVGWPYVAANNWVNFWIELILSHSPAPIADR